MIAFKDLVRIFFVLFTFFMTSLIVAQEYKINNVHYNRDGLTLEYPLKKAVDIDFESIFETKDELDLYIADLTTQFKNLRVLETAEITASYGEQVDNIIPVDLVIYTKDTNNFIAFPMPKYNSSSGLSLKIDSKNYNFLGTMETLDAELYYEFDFEDEDEDDPDSVDTHTFGIYGSYNYPFKLGIFDSSWNNSLRFDYTLGDSMPSANFSSGLGFSYQLTDVVGVGASVTQGFVFDPDYKNYGDDFYFSENASFSVPFTLAKTSNLGNISWSPSASLTYYWDIDGINSSNKDLTVPKLEFSHSLGFGRVNWIGNFKNGFSFSWSQSFNPNFYTHDFSTTTSITATYFKAFEYVGIKSRAKLLFAENTTHSFDDSLRGVYGSGVKSTSGYVVNFDLPVKVWQTDWVGYGFWDWMRYVDFEMQISPFVDIAIGENPKANSSYDIKDGLYAGGIEIIGYPSKFRSVQGRISFGVDLVTFASKVGNNIEFVDKVANKLFNTSWRNDKWYELTLGIGLFY